jgi:aryl-alcohol dehydrogenase-like predicted oxidoreductase
LSGKYTRTDIEDSREAGVAATRKGVVASTGQLSHRALGIADVVRSVAQEIGATASQVALAWTLSNPAVTAPVMGARTLAQAEDNLGALRVVLSDAQRTRLDAASALEPIFPECFIGRPLAQHLMFGGSSVARRNSTQIFKGVRE